MVETQKKKKIKTVEDILTQIFSRQRQEKVKLSKTVETNVNGCILLRNNSPKLVVDYQEEEYQSIFGYRCN
jgi:hypothetical protein